MSDIDGGEILFTMTGDATQLEAEVSRAQDALSGLESSAGDAGSGLGGMGESAGSAGKAISAMSRGGVNGLAAGLRQVNPMLGTSLTVFIGMKRAIPGLTGSTITFSGAIKGLSTALKGLAASLGPIGIGLMAGAAAYSAINFAASKYEEEVDRLNKKLAESIKINEQLNTALGGLKSMEEAVATELAILSGALTEAEVELAEMNRKVDIQINKMLAAASAADVNAEAMERNKAKITARSEALKAENALLVESRQLTDWATSSTGSNTAAQAANTAATEAQAAADKDAADAARERIAANEEGLAAFKAELDAVASESGAIIDRTVADLDKALTEVEQATIRDQEAIGQGISDTLTGVSSLSMTLANQVSEDNKKAAMALFRTSQAAGLADVAINTAVAITKALAQLGPIAGPIAAIGLTATGAAQAAMIAAQPPPAHMGDPLAPDERQVSGRRVLATEAVLDSATTRRMGGEDGLRAMMRSQASVEPVQVNLTYKHLDREVSRLMRSNSRTRRTMRG